MSKTHNEHIYPNLCHWCHLRYQNEPYVLVCVKSSVFIWGQRYPATCTMNENVWCKNPHKKKAFCILHIWCRGRHACFIRINVPDKRGLAWSKLYLTWSPHNRTWVAKEASNLEKRTEITHHPHSFSHSFIHHFYRNISPIRTAVMGGDGCGGGGGTVLVS